MTDRVLDLSESPAFLRVEYEQLKIERNAGAPVSVPLADLAVLVLGHPQITCSLAVLAGVTAHGGAVVLCDRSHLPVGMLLPIATHSTQAERFAAQVAASTPRRKRIWQSIVREKLRAQAALLAALRGDDAGLLALADRVRSGDPENLEAQGAQRYWPRLFGDAFRRRREAADQNRMLNYGYAVLRAMTARAVCAAGLHPSFGVHHHNRYDAFCLADDLMEPYRPIVDAAVADCVDMFGPDAALGPPVKRELIEPLLARYRGDGECRTLADWLHRAAASLREALTGRRVALKLPSDLERTEQGDAGK